MLHYNDISAGFTHSHTENSTVSKKNRLLIHFNDTSALTVCSLCVKTLVCFKKSACQMVEQHLKPPPPTPFIHWKLAECVQLFLSLSEKRQPNKQVRFAQQMTRNAEVREYSLLLSLFVCTNGCNTMNAFKNRKPQRVGYPHIWTINHVSPLSMTAGFSPLLQVWPTTIKDKKFATTQCYFIQQPTALTK